MTVSHILLSHYPVADLCLRDLTPQQNIQLLLKKIGLFSLLTFLSVCMCVHKYLSVCLSLHLLFRITHTEL